MPKKNTTTFLLVHPFCAFCGGSIPAQTIEHCPPKSMFEHRWWPEGYEFPSCVKCNAGSSDDDLLVSFLARMNPIDDVGDRDGRVSGLMKMIDKQLPGFFASMMPTNREARRINRQAGVIPAPGQTHQDVGACLVPPRLSLAVQKFSVKLSKAIYYKATGRIFPVSGQVAMNWFTNFELLVHGCFPVFRELQEAYGIVPEHVRAKRPLNEQFSVKWSMSDDSRFFMIQAIFGKSFGLVTFGCVESGVIGAMVRELELKNGEGFLYVVEG